MKTNIETITPKLAETILENHWVKEHQRNPSESVVDSYVRSMRAGEWILTHQGIAIDTEGELVDGVHRLLAIIRSGVTVKMMITTGLPHIGQDASTLVFDVIDRGRERGVGQQLQLRHDMPNGNLSAAVLRGILWLASYSENIVLGKFSVGSALRVADYYGSEVKYCLENRSRDYRVRNATVISAAAFAMKACPTQIKEFYNQITTGENIHSGDSAMTARRWLMNSSDKSGTLIEYRGVLTCAMKHVLQEKLAKIYDTANGYNFFLGKQSNTVGKLLASCGFGC